MKPFAPRDTVAVRPGQERPREPATQPQSLPGGGAGLLDVESGQFDELDPASKGFRHAPDDLGRGAAEEEEPRLAARPVHQNAQHREQLRDGLDLIEHDEPPLAAEGQLGVLQAAAVWFGLEVEYGGVSAGGHRARQCGLAALAGAEERGDRSAHEGTSERGRGRWPVDHAPIIS